MKGRASFAAGVVTGFVLTLILGVIATLLFLRSCAGESSQIRSQLASPDGRHVAVTFVEMGGGAAGWCEKYVDVAVRDSIFDMNKSTTGYKYEFSINCDSDVAVDWLTNDSLLLSYSLGSGARIRQKSTSDDQTVSLIYRIRD